ncbi:hypothetical protein [Streptosporangium pseudovulgare]|uniref:hypothetical protein n=1 Tax=Streptosporangium pseudovulgare TaxID=35765 RepID=UPI001E2860AE|nr:hypothetical protein [Streptosporangium pseudovulgare]
MTVDVRHLRVAAHLELASLVIMLANIATVHLKPVSSLMGPAHGCAYLFVVVAAWRLGQATVAVRAAALLPGVGGLLALRLLGRARVTERHGRGGEETVPS